MATTTPLSNPKSRAIFHSDPRMAFYHALSSTTSAATSTSTDADAVLTTFLMQAKSDPALLPEPSSSTLLAHEIGKKVFDLLLKGDGADVDINVSLLDLGIDSLLAIDLRMWWK